MKNYIDSVSEILYYRQKSLLLLFIGLLNFYLKNKKMIIRILFRVRVYMEHFCRCQPLIDLPIVHRNISSHNKTKNTGCFKRKF